MEAKHRETNKILPVEDYVAHRRSLLQKYASVWLLAFHDQDIPFYANALYETISDLTEEASISEQVKADDVSLERSIHQRPMPDMRTARRVSR